MRLPLAFIEQLYQIRNPDCSLATLARALTSRVPSSDSYRWLTSIHVHGYYCFFPYPVAVHELLFNATAGKCNVVNRDTLWSKNRLEPGEPHVFAFHKAQRTSVKVHHFFMIKKKKTWVKAGFHDISRNIMKLSDNVRGVGGNKAGHGCPIMR